MKVILDDNLSFAYEIDGYDVVRLGDVYAVVSLFYPKATGGRYRLQSSIAAACGSQGPAGTEDEQATPTLRSENDLR